MQFLTKNKSAPTKNVSFITNLTGDKHPISTLLIKAVLNPIILRGGGGLLRGKKDRDDSWKS